MWRPRDNQDSYWVWMSRCPCFWLQTNKFSSNVHSASKSQMKPFVLSRRIFQGPWSKPVIYVKFSLKLKLLFSWLINLPVTFRRLLNLPETFWRWTTITQPLFWKGGANQMSLQWHGGLLRVIDFVGAKCPLDANHKSRRGGDYTWNHRNLNTYL